MVFQLHVRDRVISDVPCFLAVVEDFQLIYSVAREADDNPR